jgi:hypothetical protein
MLRVLKERSEGRVLVVILSVDLPLALTGTGTGRSRAKLCGALVNPRAVGSWWLG